MIAGGELSPEARVYEQRISDLQQEIIERDAQLTCWQRAVQQVLTETEAGRVFKRMVKLQYSHDYYGKPGTEDGEATSTEE